MINVGTLGALIKIEDKGVDAALKRVVAGLKAIPETTTVRVTADAADVLSEAQGAETALAGIEDEAVAITGDATDALAAAGGLEAELAGIGDEGVAITGDASDALAAASTVRSELLGISDETVVVNVDTSSAQAEVQSLAQALDAIEDESVTVNVDQATQDIAGLTDASLLAGGGLGVLSGKAGMATGALAGLAGLGIAAGLNSAANAAGDLAESVNVVGLQFGDLGEEFQGFTADAPRQLGMSTRAANELGAGIQNLLTGMGLANDESADWSERLLTLGADMGSAFNKEPVVAIEAIGGALRGETEPIRQFGIMLDAASIEAKAMEMGLAGATGEVDKAGKAQAVLALIMEGTSKVQGDFANTADGLANSQRIAAGEIENASAQIGQNLAPALASAYGLVADLASGFADLPGPVQTGVLAMLGIGAVAPLALRVGEGIGGLNDKLRGTGPAGTTAAGALSAVGKGLAIAGLAYAAAQGLDALITKLNTTGRSAADFEGNLLSIATSGDSVAEVARLIGTDLEGLAGKFAAADTSAGAMLNIFDGISGKARTEAAPAIAELDARLAGLAARGPEGAAAAKILYDQIADTVGVDLAKERLSLYGATVDEGKLSAELAAPAAAALGDEAAGLAEDMAAVKDALDQTISSLKSLHGEMNAGLESHITYEAAIDALNESLQKNGTTTDISTEAGRANVEQAMRTGEGILGLAQTYLREGMSVEEATAKTQSNIDALRRQLAQAGFTEEQIDSLISTINLTPEDVATLFNTPGLSEGIEGVRGLHGQLNAIDGKSVSVFVHPKIGRVDLSGLGRGINLFHDGGVVGGSGDVPALLQSGEGVLPRSAMAALGRANFEALRKMHSGGIVGLPEQRVTLPAGGASSTPARGAHDARVVFMPGSIVVQGNVMTERDLITTVTRGIAEADYRSGR